MGTPERTPKKPWKAYGRYGSLGIELILSMGVGYYGGRWLDGRFGTHFIAVLGFVLGVYAGFRQIFRAAKQMQIDAEREEREEREAWRARAPREAPPDADDGPRDDPREKTSGGDDGDAA